MTTDNEIELIRQIEFRRGVRQAAKRAETIAKKIAEQWPKDPRAADHFHKELRYDIMKLIYDEYHDRYFHQKRLSSYVVIGRGKIQTSIPLVDMDPVVIYQSEKDGSHWVRPVAEFEDGRFLKL